MANRVSGVVPNLVNGVSQQAPALRLPSQAQLQQSFYSTIIDGLKDRPPAEFIVRLKNSLPDGAFVHVINRDVNERYIMISDGTSIEVFDFDGNVKTVTAPNGYSYLSSVVDPASDLSALTIHDFTFIVNKKKVPIEAASPVSPVRDPEALVNVVQGDYGKTYRIYINNALAASYQTPNGSVAADVNKIDTVDIAVQLKADLVTNGFDNGTTWTTTRYGNALHIVHLNGVDFDIKIEDGASGRAMKCIKTRTQHFSDLPYFGPDGFICEIVGDDATGFDNYWVAIDAQGGSSNNTQVVWKEAVKPGTKLSLSASVMPHTLVRNSDGTFTFNRATWDQRKCGDGVELSPPPSFVGKTIEAVYLHHDRLTFLSGENIIMSRTGSFFDFYRTSATALLDDDPIDIGAAHDKVSLLKGAVPYAKQLVIFSDQTQFLLTGNNDQLTPRTASLLPITDYVSDVAVKPIAVGTSIFFAAVRGEWEAVWEYVITNTQSGPQGEASETTDSIPSYIPAGMFKVIGTSNENVVVGLTKGDPGALYVYRFFYQENKKVQSSWSRWELPGVTEILDGAFINSELYLVLKRTGGAVFIEKMRMQPSVSDDSVGFMVHLDRRVHSDDLIAPSYDVPTDTTTYTLPYTPGETTRAVTSGGGAAPPALQLNILALVSNTITLQGDTRTYPIFFGNTYERRYRFSEFFVRQSNGAGGSITLQKGRLQIEYLTLDFNKTSFFKLEVTPQGRATRTYVYTGRIVGSEPNVLGEVPLVSGSKTFPIMSKSDRVTIDIVNDSWMPSSFVNALWTGTHNTQSKDF